MNRPTEDDGDQTTTPPLSAEAPGESVSPEVAARWSQLHQRSLTEIQTLVASNQESASTPIASAPRALIRMQRTLWVLALLLGGMLVALLILVALVFQFETAPAPVVYQATITTLEQEIATVHTALAQKGQTPGPVAQADTQTAAEQGTLAATSIHTSVPTALPTTPPPEPTSLVTATLVPTPQVTTTQVLTQTEPGVKRVQLTVDNVGVYPDPSAEKNSSMLSVGRILVACEERGARLLVAEQNCSQPIGWIPKRFTADTTLIPTPLNTPKPTI